MSEPVSRHGHRGTRAIQRMVEYAPATGGLALWIRHRDRPDGEGGPVIATDGTTIAYGADFVRLPLALQTGLVAHEVLHVALRHAQRLLGLRRLIGDVDATLFNICADAIVNSTLAHLTWLDLPGDAVQLDRLLSEALRIHEPVDRSLLEWSVERLYRAIDDRRPPEDGRSSAQRSSRHAQASGSARQESGGRGEEDQGKSTWRPRQDGPRARCVRALAGAYDADLLPGEDTSGPPEDEASALREWSERIVRAHAGDGAHSILRALIADMPTTRTPWEQVLRSRIARCLAPRTGPSWSRPTRSYIANQGRSGPHRRLPWEPGVCATQTVPQVALVVDVSGSIEDGLLQRFAREITAITRRHDAPLLLVIGDDQVRQVETLPPGAGDLGAIAFHGGGNTDFTPMLQEADRHRPDVMVVLTDLQGPALFQPRCPVLWAVPPDHADAIHPFGRKLILD